MLLTLISNRFYTSFPQIQFGHSFVKQTLRPIDVFNPFTAVLLHCRLYMTIFPSELFNFPIFTSTFCFNQFSTFLYWYHNDFSFTKVTFAAFFRILLVNFWYFYRFYKFNLFFHQCYLYSNVTIIYLSQQFNVLLSTFFVHILYLTDF
jgi:hypothetical protein